MTPRQAEIRAAFERLGNKAAVARELGLDSKTVRESLKLSAVDSGVQAGMTAANTELVPNVLWVKTKATDDAPGYSVMLRPQEATPEQVAEAVREALEGMTPAQPVQAPENYDSDLLTVYPLADMHLGMMAWARETGEAYDTNIAADRAREWVGRAVDASPASAEAVILDVGDMTHADDQTNQTPRSKHILDVDSRHFRTLEVAICTLAYAVEYALQKHGKVTVRILPGNHNITSYMTVLFALAERYRNEPRVEVQKVPGEFWVHQFGECLLAAHHGHGGKPERMVFFLADEHAKIWGQTRHRFLWTGHLHHMKAADIGGVQWEQLRAMTARDAYAVSNAYTARAQLQAITLHRSRGEVLRVKVAA